MKHDTRDRSGRYAQSPACDACGKPVGVEYGTDNEVCGATDGPGFFLCHRARCAKKLEGLTVEERRTLYTAQRNKNRACLMQAMREGYGIAPGGKLVSLKGAK